MAVFVGVLVRVFVGVRDGVIVPVEVAVEVVVSVGVLVAVLLGVTDTTSKGQKTSQPRFGSPSKRPIVVPFSITAIDTST